MATVQCFSKKVVHSMKRDADFYFIAIRDDEGYANDQIVGKSVFDSINPPCVLEYRLSCSGQRPQVVFSQID